MKKQKFRLILILPLNTFLILLLGSCATLTHYKTVDFNLFTDSDSVKISIDNDTVWYDLPVQINVERSKSDFQITARKDTIEKDISIKSTLSANFWLGNLFSGIGVFGYAIDMTNPKRFTYPPNMTINFDEKGNLFKGYSNFRSPQKGLLSLRLNIPEGNHFYLNKGSKFGSEFGFLGFSGGAEYYLTDKYSLDIEGGLLLDVIIPIPTPIYSDPGYGESADAIYGSIGLGSDYGRFHYSIGMQYNKTSFNKWDYLIEPEEESQYSITSLDFHKIDHNFGFKTSIYYRITNNFNLGLSYYPSFFTWDNKKIKTDYSHLMFFDLQFRFDAYRPKSLNFPF